MKLKEKLFEFKKLKNPVILIVFIVLFVYALSVFAILGWGIWTSFKTYYDWELGNILFGLPDSRFYEYLGWKTPFENYFYMLGNLYREIDDQSYISSIFGKISKPSGTAYFFDLLFNTIMYAGVACFVCAFTTMTMGFLCAKYKYKYSSLLYSITLVLMALPIVGTYPAELALLRNLGIYNTLYGMIIQNMHFIGMYFLVWIAFFKGLPDSYFEAAEIDGASQLSCFLRIALPLSAKTLGTIYLLNFMIYYNDYQTPLLYYPSYPTLADAINNLANTAGSGNMQGISKPATIAGAMILALPAIVLFVCFKDILMGNVSLGGLKE